MTKMTKKEYLKKRKRMRRNIKFALELMFLITSIITLLLILIIVLFNKIETGYLILDIQHNPCEAKSIATHYYEDIRQKGKKTDIYANIKFGTVTTEVDTQYSVQRAINMLPDNLTEIIYDNLTFIISDDEKTFDTTNDYTGEPLKAAGFIQLNSNRKDAKVTILQDTYMSDTVLHEIGHYVDEIVVKIPDDDIEVLFQEEGDKFIELLSTYYEGDLSYYKNRPEFFAHAFAYYYLHQEALRAVCPEIYAFISATVAEIN